MAKAERSVPRRAMDKANASGLIRLASWVAVAVTTATGAVTAARSELGAQRLALVLGADGPRPAPAPSSPSPSQPTRLPLGASGGAPSPSAEFDSRALTEAVRRLSAERERLLARLEAVEDAVEVTGSATKAAPKPADMSVHARTASASTPVPIVTASAPASAPLSVEAKRAPPPEAAAPAATLVPVSVVSTVQHEGVQDSRPKRLEYAIDLGTAPSSEALRALWVSVKAQQGALLDDLRPQVVTRPSAGAGGTELRLVAGPLANTLMAGRICAVLSAAGRPCQTATFEGQRLAAR